MTNIGLHTFFFIRITLFIKNNEILNCPVQLCGTSFLPPPLLTTKSINCLSSCKLTLTYLGQKMNIIAITKQIWGKSQPCDYYRFDSNKIKSV